MTGVRHVFVDTNVLVYANASAAPLHQRAQIALQNLWAAGDELWISRQVIREYIVVVTRPQTFMNPLPAITVEARVQFFEQTFQVADETPATTRKLLDLMKTYPVGGKQIHDANIVGTMLVNSVSHILSHNAADFQRYVPLIQVIVL